MNEVHIMLVNDTIMGAVLGTEEDAKELLAKKARAHYDNGAKWMYQNYEHYIQVHYWHIVTTELLQTGVKE